MRGITIAAICLMFTIGLLQCKGPAPTKSPVPSHSGCATSANGCPLQTGVQPAQTP